MEQKDTILQEQTKQLRILSCVLMYMICMAIYVFYVVLYKLTEGDYLFVHGILFFGATLLPVVYHIGFLIAHKKEWKWHYDQVIVSFLMSIMCLIVLYILIDNFPSYGGWEHFLDGIELFFMVFECLLRFIYVPVITYIAWRIRNHWGRIRLIDYYPGWVVNLITVVGWLSTMLLFLIISMWIFGW